MIIFWGRIELEIAITWVFWMIHVMAVGMIILFIENMYAAQSADVLFYRYRIILHISF